MSSSNSLATIASQIETLTTEIRGLRADIVLSQHEIDALKQEFRQELRAVRGDLALITSQQNSDIEAAVRAVDTNKKKLPGLATLSPASTGD